MLGRMKMLLIMIVILSVSIISFAVELELLSHPQNADVFIDEVWRGTTPLNVDLSPGNHTLKINKNGYQTKEGSLDIRMPTVIEYNLIPLEEVAKEFPLVLYLTNYQQSGSRTILYRENEDQLIEALQKRFENMGFTITVEKPVDEFDLIMDNISIHNMLSERHPDARLFMIVNALWSYSAFRDKKITRLETQFRIYDPKNSITLGNFQDVSESLGVLGNEITILQTVEKATQNFLDNIGNYMVERIRKDVQKPILALKEKTEIGDLFIFKFNEAINELKLYDKNNTLIETQSSSLEKIPINIIFLVDRSGSNENEIPLITSQIESLLKTLPNGFEWSLIGFDDKIEIIQSFTNDYLQWEFAKDQITSSGMTRLYDAIYNTATIFARKKGLKILILLTDGIDSDYYDTGLGSIRTEEEALNAINRSGMIVYPIGVSQKNHVSLLKKIAYISATEYHDINDYQFDDLSNIIAKDLTYTIGVAITDNSSASEYFSINGYKYQKETDNRFLNQMSLIREFDSSEKTETKVLSPNDEKEVEEKKIIIETTEASPVKTPEKEIGIKTDDTMIKNSTQTTDVSTKNTNVGEEIKTETKIENETEQQVINEEEEKKGNNTQESEKKVPENIEEETTNADEIIDEKQETQPSEDQDKDVLQEITGEIFENIVEFPPDYQELLNLKNISVFDLDRYGNLVWAQNDILYFLIPKENRIAGISLSSQLKRVSFYYPYLLLFQENEIKLLEIKKESVVELRSIKFDIPLAFMKLMNSQIIVLGYENGLIQTHSLKSNEVGEWQLESGVLNHAVIDENGRIIFSTTTARIGWLDLNHNNLQVMRIEKPVVGISPFDVDQERFLIVDASGSVYFQRFETTKPTVRNLNRGIVLKASFAETKNMLFANHWDKTLRGYRIFDLSETVLFKSKKGIESFEVDSYADKVLLSTVDNELYFYSKNSVIPQNLEKIYPISKTEQPIQKEDPSAKEAATTAATKAENTEQSNVIITEPKEEEEKKEEETKDKETDKDKEHYDTSINLSEVEKEATQKSSEMDNTEEKEKEEEIAIVLDGKVIAGDVENKTDTPIPTGKKSERELTAEELQGFEAIYGGWKSVVPYKDFGFILAGDTNMRIVNPLLQTIKNIPYSKSQLIDSAISKYNILALLFDNRIEIWDIDNLYSTKDISQISSYKFPLSNGKEVVFSRNGDYLLLVRDNGEMKIMSLDFTRGKNIYSKNQVTAIYTDMSEGEQFLYGDEAGYVGLIGIEGIISNKKVSDSPIKFVFSHKGNTYWIDEDSTVGILGGVQRTITTEKINAVYPADIDKDWILFGTEKGNLFICNSSLKQTGKTSIPYPVKDLKGYKENMISVDTFFNLKSWNLIAGSEISNKPNFNSPHGFFEVNNKLAIIMQDNTLFTYSPASDSLEKKNLADDTFTISGLLKNPTVIHNKGKNYYPFQNGELSEYAVEVFEPGKVNSSERYFIYWDKDMLSIFDVENSKTVRTFKFGEGNDLHFASVRKDRLFFFFNQSMGITNPYNPGQLVVIDLQNEGLSDIKGVFLVEGTKLGIIDSEGKIIYYMLLEDRITLPIELGKTIESAVFDVKNYRIVAKSGNDLIVFNVLDNDMSEYRFSDGIEDFTFTKDGLYVLTENGTIWHK